MPGFRKAVSVFVLVGVCISNPSRARGEVMDFGEGGEESPSPPEELGESEQELDESAPGEGVESGVEGEPDGRTPAFIFTLTRNEELEGITRDLDLLLRELVARDERYSTAEPESRLNGLDREARDELRGALELYQAAQDAMNNLDLDESAELFDRALRTLEEGVGHIDDINVIADCLLAYGMVEVLRGNSRRARALFQQILVLDPERRPDPDFYPPQVTEVYDHVVERMVLVREGAISMTIVPDDADVYVDGVPLGPGQREVADLKAGNHYVRVRRLGYVETGQVVEVSSRSTANVEIDLEPIEGGPEIDEALSRIATGAEESPDGARRIGELLGIELLLTAVVEQGEEGLMVQLTSWDALRGESVGQESFGPFVDPSIELLTSELGPSVETALSSAWTAMNVEPSEPVITPRPETLPPPPTRPFWKRWWFWTAVGAVVVGVGFGVGFGVAATSRNDDEGPNGGEVILDL